MDQHDLATAAHLKNMNATLLKIAEGQREQMEVLNQIREALSSIAKQLALATKK